MDWLPPLLFCAVALASIPVLIYMHRKRVNKLKAEGMLLSQQIDRALSNKLNRVVAAKAKRFNDLPDLGKARVIKNYARAAKYGAGIGAPVAMYTFWSFIIGPVLALVPAGVAVSWSKRLISECDEAIEDANDLHDKCINGGCGVKDCTLPKDLEHTHT